MGVGVINFSFPIGIGFVLDVLLRCFAGFVFGLGVWPFGLFSVCVIVDFGTDTEYKYLCTALENHGGGGIEHHDSTCSIAAGFDYIYCYGGGIRYRV